MFTSNFYTPRRCEAGVPVKFGLVQAREEKIADIINTSLSANTATITVRDITKISQGQRIEIKSNGSINALYLGKYFVDSVDIQQKTFTYKVYNLSQDFTIASATNVGSVYSVPNIQNSTYYIVNFTIQSSVPANNPTDPANKIDITIDRPTYGIVGSNNFYPETHIKIRSRYTDSSKVLLKASVSGVSNSSSTSSARLVYTDYQEIICAQSANKPCQIIAREERVPEYIRMNSTNNWTYGNQQFHIAKFIPDKSDNNSEVVLVQKNKNVLPNRQVRKFTITVDQNRLNLYNANIGLEDVKRAFFDGGAEEDDITVNAYVFTIADPNKTTIESIKQTIIGYIYYQNVPNPITLDAILIADEKNAIVPVIDTYELPSIAFLRYNNNGITNYIGELIFLKSVYYRDNITVRYLGQNFCGQILPIDEGVTELLPCVV